jgi:hypothetical protein
MSALSAIAHVGDYQFGATVSQDLVDDIGILAVTFIEMQLGLRPAAALDDMASPALARRIRQFLFLASQRPRNQTGRRRSAPVTVLQIRAQHPTAGAVEASVTLECDGRIRALAIRLEQEVDRWILVDIAPPEQRLPAAITAASRLGHVPIDENGMRRSTYSGQRTLEDSDEADPAP